MFRISRTRLSNGVGVIVEQMPDVESVTIGLWVAAGSRDEPRRAHGVSHFIEHMLFKGTGRRTALDIAREIESVGGMLNAFTGKEYTCFYAKVLGDDLALAVDLLSDIYLNPAFDAGELEKERQVVLQEIRMVEDTPDDLVHDLFNEFFWKGHPLGRPILGTMERIGAVDRATLLDYYGAHYHPGNVFVVAAGKLDSARLAETLEGSLGRGAAAGRTARDGAPAANRGVRIVRRPLEQVHLCMGVPGVSQSDPRRYRLYLLNTILGGGMSSRLFQEVREKRGLAYSVYSYLNLCLDAGSLVVYAGTTKEAFAEVVEIVLKEFARLRRGVKADELARAKEQLKGGILLGLETSESRMMKIARDEIYFGDVMTVDRIVEEIEGVTEEEIRGTAREFLREEDLALVALGDVTRRRLPERLKR
ncbi:MAG TPA: insulinase family protein [Deltaproteobacteria bacterium]|nr:insulinase family protein [Deltaproteobacteria bacterium]